MESERDRKIRERAYELWVQGGRSEGNSEQHWFQAEQEYAAGSESPDAASPGSAAATAAAPAKKMTRPRSAAAAGKPEAKPPAPRAGGKRAASKTGGKSDAAKAAAPER